MLRSSSGRQFFLLVGVVAQAESGADTHDNDHDGGDTDDAQLAEVGAEQAHGHHQGGILVRGQVLRDALCLWMVAHTDGFLQFKNVKVLAYVKTFFYLCNVINVKYYEDCLI